MGENKAKRKDKKEEKEIDEKVTDWKEIGEWMNKTPKDDYWWSERRKPVYYNDDNLGELAEEEWKQIERQEKMGLEADMKEA